MKPKIGKTFSNSKTFKSRRSYEDEWNDGKRPRRVDYKKRKLKTYDIMKALDDDDYEELYE